MELNAHEDYVKNLVKVLQEANLDKSGLAQRLAKPLLKNPNGDAQEQLPNNCTPLHWIAHWGKFVEIFAAIDFNKNLVNVQDATGKTPLHRSVMKSNTGILKALLKQRSIDINIQDKEGCTPLLWGVLKRRYDAVQLLCGESQIAESFVHTKSSTGDLEKKWRSCRTPIYWAARNNDRKMVDLLLKEIEKLCLDHAKKDYEQQKLANQLRQLPRKKRKLKQQKLKQQKLKLDFVKKSFQMVSDLLSLQSNKKSDIAKYTLEQLLRILPLDTIRTSDGARALLGHFLPRLNQTPRFIREKLLHVAARWASKNVIKKILDADSDGNMINCKDDQWGTTALHIAVTRKNKEIVEYLLDNKADIDAETKNQYTALLIAVQHGDEDMVKVLLKHNPHVDRCTSHQYTAVHIAAKHMKNGILKLLIEAGANCNAKKTHGFTPLHLAVKYCSKKRSELKRDDRRGEEAQEQESSIGSEYETVDILLNVEGIDVNAVTDKNVTAFHLALWKKGQHPALLTRLLDVPQLQVKAASSRGYTPLHIAIINHDRLELVEAIIVKLNREVEHLDFRLRGKKPIIEAFTRKKFEIGTLLLTNGASIDETEWTEHQLLHILMRHGDTKHVQKLLEGGKKIPTKLFDFPNSKGTTPFHVAAEHNTLELVQLLCEKLKFGIGLENERKETPLHLAASRDKADVVSHLLTLDESQVVPALKQEDQNHWSVLEIALVSSFSKTISVILKTVKSLLANSRGTFPFETMKKWLKCGIQHANPPDILNTLDSFVQQSLLSHEGYVEDVQEYYRFVTKHPQLEKDVYGQTLLHHVYAAGIDSHILRMTAKYRIFQFEKDLAGITPAQLGPISGQNGERKLIRNPEECREVLENPDLGVSCLLGYYKEICTKVNELMRDLADSLHVKCHLSGSNSELTKQGKPDEFDYMFTRKATDMPSLDKTVEEFRSRRGKDKIFWPRHCLSMTSKNFIETFPEQLRAALATLEKMGSVPEGLYIVKPCREDLTILKLGLEYRCRPTDSKERCLRIPISVDVVPCLEVDKVLLKGKGKKPSTTTENAVDKQTWSYWQDQKVYLVPKDGAFEDDNLRISYSDIETRFMREIQPEWRLGLILLKAFREPVIWGTDEKADNLHDIVSSYILKTSLIHTVHRIMDREHRNGKKLTVADVRIERFQGDANATQRATASETIEDQVQKFHDYMMLPNSTENIARYAIEIVKTLQTQVCRNKSLPHFVEKHYDIVFGYTISSGKAAFKSDKTEKVIAQMKKFCKKARRWLQRGYGSQPRQKKKKPEGKGKKKGGQKGTQPTTRRSRSTTSQTRMARGQRRRLGLTAHEKYGWKL